MISILKVTKGYNSVKNVSEAIVFNFYTSFDDPLYLYPVL